MTSSINKFIDIILQGPMHPYTPQIAQEYMKLPFVNRIIVSCWETDPDYPINQDILVLKNKDVFYPGIGNRNRQIKSSREGLNYVATEYAAKMRTDQLVSFDSMHKLYNYYFNNCESIIPYSNGIFPKNKIAVHGICKDFAFHPIDHIYWGNTQDLVDLFDVEYDMTEYPKDSKESEFNNYIRSETYITIPYVARFNIEVKNIIKNPRPYLYDNSENKSEALKISHDIMDKIFTVFPKIQMNWIKYGMQQYHYDVMETERGGHAYWAKD